MFEYLFVHPISLLTIAHIVLMISLLVRVVMRKPATGVALAWILFIVIAPFFGAFLYLLIGERRLGRRAKILNELRRENRRIAAAAIAHGLTDVDWGPLPDFSEGMNRLGNRLAGFPAFRGSTFALNSDTDDTLRSMIKDIDSAKKHVLMEFYIWNSGGLADEVLESIKRAAQRGVYCCVLLDALGSRPFLRSKQPAELRAAGVEVVEALPVGIIRSLFTRNDLRLHRKIVVVDGKAGWTGSMNLVDPRYFKQDAGFGHWVDAMVRVEGSIVVPLAATFLSDWAAEHGRSMGEYIERAELKLVEPVGNTVMQVIPSGPGETEDAQLQMILTLIQSAEREIILTTPYFVPDESLFRAVCGAANRGVDVHLVVPKRVDSIMTRFASRSYFDELLASGISIHRYQAGLLHTKSITVDSQTAMFGTVNLDMRSLWLNYEVALYVYDKDFAQQLRSLQLDYIQASEPLIPALWKRRSFWQRANENLFRLASPLL